MNAKPGIKTTEFWAMIFNVVLMVLVASGLVSQNEATDWEALLVPLAAAVIPLVAYIQGRAKVKARE